MLLERTLHVLPPESAPHPSASPHPQTHHLRQARLGANIPLYHSHSCSQKTCSTQCQLQWLLMFYYSHLLLSQYLLLREHQVRQSVTQLTCIQPACGQAFKAVNLWRKPWDCNYWRIYHKTFYNPLLSVFYSTCSNCFGRLLYWHCDIACWHRWGGVQAIKSKAWGGGVSSLVPLQPWRSTSFHSSHVDAKVYYWTCFYW